MRDVARRFAVEIALAHVERIELQAPCDRGDHAFDREHALRAAETAERGVRHRIRLATMRGDAQVRQEVRVVAVEHRTVVDRAGQIRRDAATRGEHQVERLEVPRLIEAGVVLVQKIMALAGADDVVVAVGAQLDRPAGGASEQRRGDRVHRSLRLLAAKATAEAPQLDRDRSVGNVERSGDKMLDLGRVLRRRIQQHLAALPGNGKRDLSLEIEMLLAAAAELPREAQFAAGRTPVAAADLQRRQDDPSLGECLLDRD